MPTLTHDHAKVALDIYAENLANAADNCAFWINTTDHHRLDWEPAGLDGAKGRSIYAIAHELAERSRYFRGVLKGDEYTPNRDGHSYNSAEQASKDVRDSAYALAEAIKGLSAEALEGTIDFGPRKLPMKLALSIFPSHYSYHGGQINYIETLYGDKQFRPPLGPTN